MEDNAMEEFDNDLYIDALIDKLSERTTILNVNNEDIIVFEF